MEKIFGKSICEGIAIGKIKYLATEDSSVAKTHIEDTEHEVNRYETAKKRQSRSWNSSMKRLRKRLAQSRLKFSRCTLCCWRIWNTKAGCLH